MEKRNPFATKPRDIQTSTQLDNSDDSTDQDRANDLDLIFDNLYIGGKKAATDKARLHELGIKRILNVTC